MDTLQAELRDNYPILDIQIIGINEFGQDPAGANDLMTANRTTPWLQDVDGNANQVSDVWYDSWGVTYRDVIILDGQNEMVDVYNLTANDLGVAANYATMRDKLLDAAMIEQKPWQNQRDRFDVNDDGFVVPGDVLSMINEINANGPTALPPPTGTSLAAPFWDSNGDNFFSPVDILQVINFIEGVAPEGEASGQPVLAINIIVNEVGASSSLADSNSLVTHTFDDADETAFEPTHSANGTQFEPSLGELAPASESMDDDFWAEYWPSR